MGLGRHGTLHGIFVSRSCPFPLGRSVSRKAGKKTLKVTTTVLDCPKTIQSWRPCLGKIPTSDKALKQQHKTRLNGGK